MLNVATTRLQAIIAQLFIIKLLRTTPIAPIICSNCINGRKLTDCPFPYFIVMLTTTNLLKIVIVSYKEFSQKKFSWRS